MDVQVARSFMDRRELGEDARRLLDELDVDRRAGAAGECSPPVDVIETPSTVEILMDLPGVAPDAVQVVFSRGTLIVAGRKLPPGCSHRDAAFHLAERAFGRFARLVRLAGAVDAGRARASLSGGELRIVVPRIAERRGHDIRIDVQAR
jgi:HSP20 family protein